MGDNVLYWVLVLTVMVPLTLVAAYIDGAYRRVPNWSTYGLALLGLLANIILPLAGHGALGTTWYGALGWSLLGWFVGLLPLFAVFFIHGMGAGDVKLIAAWGAWLGSQLVLVTYVVGLLLGGVMAILIVLTCGRLRQFLASFSVLKEKFSDVKRLASDFASTDSLVRQTRIPKLPYGVPLTIGMLFVLSCHLIGPPGSRQWYEQFFQDLRWPIG